MLDLPGEIWAEQGLRFAFATSSLLRPHLEPHPSITSIGRHRTRPRPLSGMDSPFWNGYRAPRLGWRAPQSPPSSSPHARPTLPLTSHDQKTAIRSPAPSSAMQSVDSLPNFPTAENCAQRPPRRRFARRRSREVGGSAGVVQRRL